MILDIQRRSMEPGITVLEMAGRIAMGSDSQRIEWAVAELLKENNLRVIFDLTKVMFLDSSGIGILMMCHAKLEKVRGALHIAGAQGMVQETIDITGLSKIVPNYATVAGAAQAFPPA